MSLVPIKYSELNSKQKEIFNFQKVAALLADYGYNCIKLADDWQGADFLAYHIDGISTFRVQLKSRVTIDKKYETKDLHMAFPVRRYWYLIEHDKLVQLADIHTNWLESKSWKISSAYSITSPNKKFMEALEPFRLGKPVN